MKIIISLLILFSASLAFTAADFPENNKYRRDVVNPEKDSFCPRLEGVYPDHCCPYKQKAPIKCYYYNNDRVRVGTNSTGLNCVGGVGGTVVQTACCNVDSVPCITDVTEKTFIQRLIKRDLDGKNRCNFEACPLPKYWKGENIQGTQISRTKPTTALCSTVAATSQCSVSTTLPNCNNLNPTCPLPAPEPTPGPVSPTPTPTPTYPTPTPGPTYPNPTPSYPDPAPSTPTPSPSPSTPTPSPTTPTPTPAPPPDAGDTGGG